MYTIQLTKEERECLIEALMFFESDTWTTDEGKELANQVLDKICSALE